MRIAILTLPLHTNYGGILQAYALQTVLQRMGHEVLLIEKERDLHKSRFRLMLSYGKYLVKRYLLREDITYTPLEQLNAVNAELLSQISAGGGRIDDIFFCPHRPEDNCDCRKPKTKMGLQAIEKYGLDPAECWMVGDHDKDIEFGRQLGMRTVKVSEETSFSDAVDIILSEGAKSQNNPNNREETY